MMVSYRVNGAAVNVPVLRYLHWPNLDDVFMFVVESCSAFIFLFGLFSSCPSRLRNLCAVIPRLLCYDWFGLETFRNSPGNRGVAPEPLPTRWFLCILSQYVSFLCLKKPVGWHVPFHYTVLPLRVRIRAFEIIVFKNIKKKQQQMLPDNLALL